MDGKKQEHVLDRLDVGLAAELKHVFISLGFTTEDVKALCKRGALASVLWQARGFGVAKTEISIDRTRGFEDLLGKDWGDLVVDHHDPRSATIDKINLADICLEHTLQEGEEKVPMSVRDQRLTDANLIPLDAYAYRIFWERREQIPLWLRRKDPQDWHHPMIVFRGTAFKGRDGYRCCLAMYWEGEWKQSLVNLSPDCVFEKRYVDIVVPG